jgi:YidC/Oxa1 family membrane protein insertase
MDPFSFPPLSTLVEGAYRLLDGLISLIHPIAGTSSAALAILILTGLVRALLVPVGVSQVKAEGTRRRLYPQLIELQRRHRKDPVTLQQKTAELYRAENSSQFAGFLPALAQAPVLSVVYTLFVRTSIDGHANALLDHQLFSAPLGGSFLQIGADGSGSILVYLVLFAVLAMVAAISRHIALRLQLIDPAAPTSAATLTRALSWLPFATIVFAAIVPLAAALYLAASATWTLGERMLLRRWYWGGPERSAHALSTPLR